MTTHPKSSSLTDFPSMVTAAGGLHPLEVLESLRLAAERGCTESAQLYLEGLRLEEGHLDQGRLLALPHPLDAEWRFDDDTADHLLDHALNVTSPGDAILLLGVPTVALRALDSTADRRFVVRSEANVIGAALEARAANDPRFLPEAADGCSCAVLDPPWYPAVFDLLVGLAAQACRFGATIMVGAPSLKVRPSVTDERSRSIQAGLLAGLHFVSVAADALIYRTPAFEVAAMRAGQLGRWLPDWRRGDLLYFEKRHAGITPTPIPQTPAFEITIEGVRLRLVAQNALAGYGLAPLVPGEVFPSVSMRAAGRKRANLWTSGNRAFVCNTRVTLAAMQALAADFGLWPKGLKAPPIDSQIRQEVAPIQSVDDLARIVARDCVHMAELVGEASWDRSVNDARFLNGSSAVFLKALRGAGA